MLLRCFFCPYCPVQYCLEDERCIQYFDNICVILQTVLTVGAAVCMIYCLLVLWLDLSHVCYNSCMVIYISFTADLTWSYNIYLLCTTNFYEPCTMFCNNMSTTNFVEFICVVDKQWNCVVMQAYTNVYFEWWLYLQELRRMISPSHESLTMLINYYSVNFLVL